ncbi:MAG: hypothetical protein M3509_10020, partial [Chloroflexota bacterium]|nr:hypothetical protein [Chloroflexota bacterium]
MGTVTTTRPRRPTTVEDLHRLAELGRDRGLRLFEPAPNHWYCTSHSASFALHTLTAWSCDCRGFIAHGRCSHYALLLSELGWLPGPEPEPPAVVETLHCRTCGHRVSGQASFCSEACAARGPLAGASGPIRML